MFTIITCAITAFLAYLLGEQTAFRVLYYRGEAMFSSLNPGIFWHAWFGQNT